MEISNQVSDRLDTSAANLTIRLVGESVWVDTSGAAAVGLACSKVYPYSSHSISGLDAFEQGRQLHDGPLWLESRSAIHQSEPSQGLTTHVTACNHTPVGAFLALVLRGSKQQQVSVP